MKEYIILVAVSAILAALADILAPKEWHGYIKVITGFLILTVLLSPAFKLKNIDVFEVGDGFEASDRQIKDLVAEELTKRVEDDIRERILTEFNTEIAASVELEINENHQIAGVKSIVVTGGVLPSGVRERLEEVYGCESVELRFEQNSEKIWEY